MRPLALDEREFRPVGFPHPGMHIAPVDDEHRDNPRAGRDGETVDTVLVRGRRAEKILVQEDIVREEGVVVVRYVSRHPQSGLACFLVDEPKAEQHAAHELDLGLDRRESLRIPHGHLGHDVRLVVTRVDAEHVGTALGHCLQVKASLCVGLRSDAADIDIVDLVAVNPDPGYRLARVGGADNPMDRLARPGDDLDVFMVNGLAAHHLLRGDFHHLVRDRGTADVESNGSIAPIPRSTKRPSLSVFKSVVSPFQLGDRVIRWLSCISCTQTLTPETGLALEIDDAAAHRDVVRDEFQLIDVGLAARPAQRRAIAVGARDNLGPGHGRCVWVVE